MSGYRLTQIEIDQVLLTDAKTRLAYTVKRVADWETIWTLKDDTGFVLLGEASGNSSVPLWPFAEYAQLSCSGIWAHAHPEEILLNKFIEKWITGMSKDKRKVAVFPTPNDKAVVMLPEQFKKLLDDALTEYE